MKNQVQSKQLSKRSITISFDRQWLDKMAIWIDKRLQFLLAILLIVVSIGSFAFFYRNEVGIAYNDARSHLDISRRVVEGLKPGLAQLGSVWLPLPHVLMIPTIWNNFMWHSGLSGALVSMISYLITGMYIYKFLSLLNVGKLGKVVGVLVFALNINILYLQSTAMTELLLLATMTAGSYYLALWAKTDQPFDLMKSAFSIMLATLVRYDGWFLLASAVILVTVVVVKNKQKQNLDGIVIFFCTLAGVGIVLWFVWNQLIFSDALYFMFGPFSARAQQELLKQAGELFTEGNFILSLQHYVFAVMYNSNTYISLLGLMGALALLLNKNIHSNIRIMSLALVAPFLFNVIALYFGHSVLYVQGLSGDTWFNIRYGIMMMPSVAVFVGFLINQIGRLKQVAVATIVFVIFFSYTSNDAVTIDDAIAGKSQKNVTGVSNWLKDNITNKDGYVLVSAASHDAVIFSSKQPMARFIHEGTGKYWDYAIKNPSIWARWIIMRTDDTNDLTFSKIKDNPELMRYELVDKYPFADVYKLKDEYVAGLITKPVLGKQK